MGNVQPTAGSHYISMECGGGPGGEGEGFSLTLCQGVTFVAGQQYCISLDLITWKSFCTPISFNGCPGNSRLAVYGSNSPCTTNEVLWSSPALSGTWTEYTFCFIPTGSWSVISFRVLNPVTTSSAVAVDNMSITSVDGDFLSGCTTLDVDWLGLEVQCRANALRIVWTCTTEDDVLTYDVERSSDLLAWQRIGTVDAVASFGLPVTYDLLDASLDHTTSEPRYYRVRSNDANGRSFYSPVVVGECDLVVHPNPASEWIMVRSRHADVQVVVLDATGRLVRTHYVAGMEARIDISDLAAGYYAVTVQRSGLLLAKGVFIRS
jgi:hypothetical protein